MGKELEFFCVFKICATFHMKKHLLRKFVYTLED